MKKEVFFVCSVVKNKDLIQRVLSSKNFSEARMLFLQNEGVSPNVISGPFFKKRGFDLECLEDLKFSGVGKKAIFEDWEVNAQILIEPENCAYLFFKKRIDGKNISQPDGHVVVDVQSLRFI